MSWRGVCGGACPRAEEQCSLRTTSPRHTVGPQAYWTNLQRWGQELITIVSRQQCQCRGVRVVPPRCGRESRERCHGGCVSLLSMVALAEPSSARELFRLPGRATHRWRKCCQCFLSRPFQGFLRRRPAAACGSHAESKTTDVTARGHILYTSMDYPQPLRCCSGTAQAHAPAPPAPPAGPQRRPPQEAPGRPPARCRRAAAASAT